MLTVETKIELNKFKLREWQYPVFKALESGVKRAVVVVHRRAGKDFMAFNFCIRELIRNPGMLIFYSFPTFGGGRKTIWDGRTHTGQTFRSYIPKELIKSENSSEMSITLVNNSILQVVGTNQYDNLRGTNPRGVVFSEYSRQDPEFYQSVIRPILRANDGWALFLSTPYGRNHFFDLYQIAKNMDDWYHCFLTVDDTGLITSEDIQKERAEGMPEDKIQQEFFCSFDAGVEGSYYCKYIDRMKLNNQIGTVPWEPNFKVNTAWDLGINDPTVIIFFQLIGQTIRIIDYYESSDKPMSHFVNILQQKPYVYGKHFPPHDIMVRELGSGLTRREMYKQLGINFSEPCNIEIEDGIEAVRAVLSKVWIDETKCEKLIKALENYRQEWDEKRKIYKGKPLHDNHSHGADAMRYLAVALPKTKDGMTDKDVERMRQEAMYGEQSNLPSVFRTDLPNHQ